MSPPDGAPPSLGQDKAALSAGPERRPLLAFATDPASLATLQDGLREYLPPQVEFRRGGLRDAIAALRQRATPVALIVDISGEANPFPMLDDLSQVVEPGVRVLVVGETDNVDVYRRLVHGLGIVEYLYKPLSAEIVARHFGPRIGGVSTAPLRGGRIVSVTGVRGGAGATTIAANLAWHLGQFDRRYTILFDPDLYSGTAALLLGVKVGPGLRAALEHPERIDELLLDRTARRVHERLHLLAGEEDLSIPPDYAAGAGEAILAVLQRRYNFIVLDVPPLPNRFYRDLLHQAHQRVFVMDPTLASCRDALRLLALPPGMGQTRPGILVVNHADRPGSLSRRDLERALGSAPALFIPDRPRSMEDAATLGRPAAMSNARYHHAIARLAHEVAAVRAPDPLTGLARLWRRQA